MNLARIQLLSLATKAVTTVLGVVQSIVVVRLLSPAEFGLVGLVTSIGGVVGVTQHLGIVDGAIREIAVLKRRRDVGAVFWISHVVRQLVTIPVSLVLLVLAPTIARAYGRLEIAPYIQVFAAILILQGLQDVLGATLTGMKRFFALYVVQIVTATINVIAFGYLTWRFGVGGFFWAIVLTTSIMIALFVAVVRRDLRGYLAWPSWHDAVLHGRRLLKIGVFMYLSRIFFIVWQRLPLLLLGGVLAADQLGYLNVSLTFGARLTIIAAALSEVNLSWMSSLFAHRRHEFVAVITRNMHRVFVLLLLLTLVLLYFTPEVLTYIIGPEYLPAQPLIVVMTVAFFLYALTDIGSSSLFVAADKPWLRVVVYGFMTALSAGVIGTLLVVRPEPLFAAWAVLLGAGVAYGSLVFIARRYFGVAFVPRQLAFFLGALALSVWWLLSEPSLLLRLPVFLIFVGYVGWGAYRAQLFPDIRRLRLGERRPQDERFRIVCFAGAAYDQPSWTNRQQMMSRVSAQYPVFYVEPRVWIFRFLFRYWREPLVILSFLQRLVWYEQKHERLYVKAQWNLVPGSREVKLIAACNHYLNRWCVLLTAWWLGFGSTGIGEEHRGTRRVAWLYDTEAAEYLSAFPDATVLYDCVDDHAAQAGVDRNPHRVREEERTIVHRADVVTVTSQRLLDLKQADNPHTYLVLNAGDVALYLQAPTNVPAALERIPHPRLGMVGALDSYKVGFDLLREVAQRHPQWHFVLIGEPVVHRTVRETIALEKLANVHLLGVIPREQVPAYVYQFDLCLIPYRDNQYNQASFPLKFWEFMATGKPIVVSGVPELRSFEPHIGYANSPDTFARLCASWLEHPERAVQDRVALAREHTWERRAERVLALLEQHTAAH